MRRTHNDVPTPAPILTAIPLDAPSDDGGSSRLFGEADSSEIDIARVGVCWEGSREMETAAEVGEGPGNSNVVYVDPGPSGMKLDVFLQPWLITGGPRSQTHKLSEHGYTRTPLSGLSVARLANRGSHCQRMAHQPIRTEGSLESSSSGRCMNRGPQSVWNLADFGRLCWLSRSNPFRNLQMSIPVQVAGRECHR